MGFKIAPKSGNPTQPPPDSFCWDWDKRGGCVPNLRTTLSREIDQDPIGHKDTLTTVKELFRATGKTTSTQDNINKETRTYPTVPGIPAPPWAATSSPFSFEDASMCHKIGQDPTRRSQDTPRAPRRPRRSRKEAPRRPTWLPKPKKIFENPIPRCHPFLASFFGRFLFGFSSLLRPPNP